MNRAYGLLEIKDVNDEERIIEGIASTPVTDRQGDIVEPEGAVFNLPIPLLWQHRSSEPVGNVIKAKVSKQGIWIRAQIAKHDEPGELKNLLDKAWGMIKLGLVRGLSIGFKPLESSDIEGTWGQRFNLWEWLELSAVTIPANADASISAIKAAFGRQQQEGDPQPGASGTRKSVSIITPPKPSKGTMKTTAEQIADFEAARASKSAQLTAIQNKASAEGRTKDATEQEEFNTIRDEIASIDQELIDLRAMEKLMGTVAKPVNGGGSEKGSESRSPQVRVEAEEKLEPGIEFARFAMCVAAAKGDMRQALALAEHHYPRQKRAISVIKASAGIGSSIEKMLFQMKAAVNAGTTTDATWAGPLLAYNTFSGDFLEYLRPRTILGRFGNNGVPDLNRIPFNVHIKGQTSGGTGYWVGEGKPKPVTKFDFNDTYHGFTKVAAIAALTEELIRFSDPSAERLVRDALSGCLIERMDSDFVNPAIAAQAGVRPASITNGVAAIGSSGTDGDAVRTDIQALWAGPVAARLPMTGAVYITTPAIALALSLMMNALGQREFPDLNMMGGTLLGVPVIVSDYVPAGLFILAFAPEIWYSDDGQVTIDASREASLQMDDAPTNASNPVAATAMVSMFQTDSIALRAHRFVNWTKRRNSAVAMLEDVAWGGAVIS